jgi:hypothetical protein
MIPYVLILLFMYSAIREASAAAPTASPTAKGDPKRKYLNGESDIKEVQAQKLIFEDQADKTATYLIKNIKAENCARGLFEVRNGTHEIISSIQITYLDDSTVSGVIACYTMTFKNIQMGTPFQQQPPHSYNKIVVKENGDSTVATYINKSTHQETRASHEHCALWLRHIIYKATGMLTP